MPISRQDGSAGVDYLPGCSYDIRKFPTTADDDMLKRAQLLQEVAKFVASYVSDSPGNREILYWGRPPVIL